MGVAAYQFLRWFSLEGVELWPGLYDRTTASVPDETSMVC